MKASVRTTMDTSCRPMSCLVTAVPLKLHPSRHTRRECLDRTLIHGERHLLATLSEYVAHYNDHCQHQGRNQLPPNTDQAPVALLDLAATRVQR